MLIDCTNPADSDNSPAPLFDPACWVGLPNGNAVHRSDLRPCGQCGGRRMRVCRRRVGCPDCAHFARDDVTVAWLDAVTGRVEPVRRGG